MSKKNSIVKSRAPAVGLRRLVRLAQDLRHMTGMTPGVSVREGRLMPPEQFASKLRDFADWYQRDCENRSQTVEKLLHAALDDEANAERSSDGGPQGVDSQPAQSPPELGAASG